MKVTVYPGAILLLLALPFPIFAIGAACSPPPAGVAPVIEGALDTVGVAACKGALGADWAPVCTMADSALDLLIERLSKGASPDASSMRRGDKELLVKSLLQAQAK
mgnify:CR=1 FL=1